MSGFSNTNNFTVDTVAPAAPVVSLPANGSSTNNTKPPISGTAEADSTVTVYIDGSSVGTTPADGSGNWTYTPTTALSNASHTVKATATDPASNVSGFSNTNTFTVNTVPPVPPVVSTPEKGSFTNNTEPPLTGSAPAGSTVKLYLDGTLVATVTAERLGHLVLHADDAAVQRAAHGQRDRDRLRRQHEHDHDEHLHVDTIAPAKPVLSGPAERVVHERRPSRRSAARPSRTAR